jgi:dihydropteroate synthase
MKAEGMQIRPANSVNIVVTSYEFLTNKKDSARLAGLKWHYLILDEGHRIKNADCQLSSIMRKYKIKHKLLLTGTPLQNQLSELWSLLNFLVRIKCQVLCGTWHKTSSCLTQPCWSKKATDAGAHDHQAEAARHAHEPQPLSLKD